MKKPRQTLVLICETDPGIYQEIDAVAVLGMEQLGKGVRVLLFASLQEEKGQARFIPDLARCPTINL